MTDIHLLVDARPISHPTAGGRGIGNYTLGLLHGLVSIGASFTALVEHDQRLGIRGVPASSIETFGREIVRRTREGTWYVATGMFLHPLSFDPIPAIITERRLPVAEVVHDVIPLQQPDVYLVDERARRLATLRAGLARTADLHVANSRYSASTAIDVLRLDPRRVAVIGAGVDRRFRLPSVEDRRAVVAVTGADPRKNTEALLDTWSRIDEGLRERHGLVVIAGVDEATAGRWGSIAAVHRVGASVHFIRNASDDEVVRHLQSAALVVRPSLAEGFGLPVVEAAACGAPVVCSNVDALPEVLDEPAATFDPEDVVDMARAIERGLTDADHRAVLRSAGTRAVSRWQWPRVATDLVAALRCAPAGLPPPGPPLAIRMAIVVSSAPDERDPIIRVVRADPAVTLFGDRTALADASWPAGSLGPYRKFHEFDGVVTLVDGDPRSASHACRSPPSDPCVVRARLARPPRRDHRPLADRRLDGRG